MKKLYNDFIRREKETTPIVPLTSHVKVGKLEKTTPSADLYSCSNISIFFGI